jgi:xylulokinase
LLLPKDYIAWKLTGEFSTDVSDASGTGFLDVRRREWSDEILEGLDVRTGILPRVYESDEIVGKTSEGVPVVAGAGDQAAGGIGVGAVRPGTMSVSLGTSGVVFTADDNPRPNFSGSVHVFGHANRSWLSMGVMLSCGGALRWVRDTFFSGQSYDEMAELAQAAPAGSEGVFFLPTLAGERCPFVDPHATAALAGMTLAHGRGHLARAAFEGISFGLALCLDSVTAGAARPSRLRLTGGGSRSDFWVQLLADVTQTPCVTMESDNGPAFGAAILAGVGIGIWKDVEQASEAMVREQRVIEPGNSQYENVIAKYKRLYPALKDWAASPFGLK